MGDNGLRWSSLGYGLLVDGAQTTCVCPGTANKLRAKSKLGGEITNKCELENVPNHGLQLCCKTAANNETSPSPPPPRPPPPRPPPSPPADATAILAAAANAVADTTDAGADAANNGTSATAAAAAPTCYHDWKPSLPPPRPPLVVLDGQALLRPPASPHPPPCPLSVCGQPGFVETHLGGASSGPVMVSRAACAGGCPNSVHFRDMSCVNYDLNGDGVVDSNDCMSKAGHADFCSCCEGPSSPPLPPPIAAQLVNAGPVVDALCDSKDLYATVSTSSAARRLKTDPISVGALLAKGWTPSSNGSWHTNTPWNASVHDPEVLEDVLNARAGWRVSSGRFINGHHRLGSLRNLTVREARLACARDPGCVAFSYERAHWLRNRSARMRTVLVGVQNGTGMMPLGPTIYRRPVEMGGLYGDRTPSSDPDAAVLKLAQMKPWEWLDGQLSWSTHFNPAFFPPTNVATGSDDIQHLWPYQEAISQLPKLVEELGRALHPWASRATAEVDFHAEVLRDLNEMFPSAESGMVREMFNSMVDFGLRNEAATKGKWPPQVRRRGSVSNNDASEKIADAICTSRAVARECLEHGSSTLLSTTCAKKMLADLTQAVSGAALGSKAFECMAGGKCPARTSSLASGIEYCTQLFGSGVGIQPT